MQRQGASPGTVIPSPATHCTGNFAFESFADMNGMYAICPL